MSLAAIARILAPTARTRGNHEPGLSAEGWFYTDHMVFPYGIHVAVVRVDRGTGGIAIERYMVAYDVGRAINPMMIEVKSPADWRKALVAPCTKSSVTTNVASRWL